ncbi:cyclic lactone autoinducer peptide [Rummeliibacillus suwonensis]|uniref:cyclic lactone autoinducer peptide n=1 Tax=Rummeliibacillus suwonensis TaxID=1306154 RepID=UPI0011B5AE03|nr:cyclic lactone autoinducer peptide [Rummeliibacillus suwonensis]
MNVKFKPFQSTKSFVLTKLSKLAMIVGGLAVVNICTFFFHEEEIPKELKENHPFLK